MDQDKNRVLVTGATGFIGRALVAALLQQDYQVRVLIRGESPFNGLPIQVHQGDLMRADSLIGIERDIDIVIHCAALLGKWSSAEQLIIDTNVQGSLNLYRRFANNSAIKLLHISAGGVTGPLGSGLIADEQTACLPATAYEKSKLLAETECLNFAAKHQLNAIILRPTFTYGPLDGHKLPLFQAIKNRRFAFIGNGESLLSPVYIEDVTQGILLAMQCGVPGSCYILSGSEPVSKKQLVYCIADSLHTPRPRLKIPYRPAMMIAGFLEKFATSLGFQPFLTRAKVMMMGDNFAYNCAKAQRELGYKPQFSLHRGINNTIRYYRQHGLL